MWENIKYYWIFFKINFILSAKQRLEYSTNLISSLIQMAVNFSITLLFLGPAIINIVGKDINWTLLEYVLLIFIANIIRLTAGLFYFGKSLKLNIIRGKLNFLLYTPKNPMIKYFIKHDNQNYFILLPIMFICFTPYLYSNIENLFIHNIIYIIIILLLTIFLKVVIYSSLNSISFWFLPLGNQLALHYQDSEGISYQYPGIFFKDSKIEILAMLFPMYFVSVVIIPLLKGVSIYNFIFEIQVLILINIILTIITTINWYFGLKRYEGYD